MTNKILIAISGTLLCFAFLDAHRGALAQPIGLATPQQPITIFLPGGESLAGWQNVISPPPAAYAVLSVKETTNPGFGMPGSEAPWQYSWKIHFQNIQTGWEYIQYAYGQDGANIIVFNADGVPTVPFLVTSATVPQYISGTGIPQTPEPPPALLYGITTGGSALALRLRRRSRSSI